jgi:hypothetical protein
MTQEEIVKLFQDPKVEEILSELIKKESPTYINHSGVNNNLQQEVMPEYEQAKNEAVYKGKTNSFIVLGADRNAGRGSGKGGKGYTGAAAIDIFTGLGGARPVIDDKSPKNFEMDASRIYISQKADIDKYFGIPQYKADFGPEAIQLEDSDSKAAIAIKSDCVRIIGRENIKIVTQHTGENSNGDLKPLNGIDIIAGYDALDFEHTPQPMVKGDNLIAALRAIIKTVEKVQSTMADFIDQQIKINNALSRHSHQLNTGKLMSSEMIDNRIFENMMNIFKDVVPGIIKNNMDFQVFLKEYFDLSSEKYINSKHNRVN